MIALGYAIYALSPNISSTLLVINIGLTTLNLTVPLVFIGYRFMVKKLLAYTGGALYHFHFS